MNKFNWANNLKSNNFEKIKYKNKKNIINLIILHLKIMKININLITQI